MDRDHIRKNVKRLLGDIPEGVELVAAAKARTPEEVQCSVEAGIRIVGENYLQDAVEAYSALGDSVKWHFIGHLQKNKVAKAVRIFDMIETVDSPELAGIINKRADAEDKLMSVLIEVNSGVEAQKAGVHPSEVEDLAVRISKFDNLKLEGLMTMGPYSSDPEEVRPYFAETKRIFDLIAGKSLPGVEMKYLSMGMSASYRVAIEEGANLVRIGTAIYGERNYC